ncbi:MAG: 4Fe-4S dicluster domain-containing protein [Fibrobacteria bacterium]|nr:4Fe-4S dicluster domain-containing protein [Fibrobacteria bacterium]
MNTGNTITREIYWNVAVESFPVTQIVMYGLVFIAMGLFVHGLVKGGFLTRFKMWRLGIATDDDRLSDKAGRAVKALVEILTHKKILERPVMGAIHFCLFWGFLTLVAATTLVFIQADVTSPLLGVTFLKGNFYLFFSMAADIGGGLALLAVMAALVRRYFLRPAWLDNRIQDTTILWLLLLILASGFCVEALRMQATELQAGNPMGPYVWFSPVGRLFAFLFAGSSVKAAETFHRFIWWTHLAFSLSFIVYIAYSKLLHMFMTPVNIFLRSDSQQAPLKIMSPEIFENAETFGVHNIEEYTWKDLFDTEACMRCGRCVEVCPAYNTDKPLRPRDVIQNMRNHLEEKSKFVMGEDGKAKIVPDEEYKGPALIGECVDKDTAWACTTCMACVEACPAYIHQFPKLIDLRRYLVMMESDFPEEMNEAFKGMENNSNPWSLGAETRGDWAKPLNVPLMAEKQDAEYLYYVGCAGSFDDRNQKVSTAVASLLQKAGVDFAILGAEEGCCGDSARRAGNEYLAQMLIQQNIETFGRYKVKKIIASCPHGYNILKNEYAQLGGEYEVYHHTEILAKLLDEGKLKPNKELQGKITLHESCYLTRYNSILEPPRKIINAVPGAQLSELDRNRKNSFCCGAGGGRMWMEEKLGTAINVNRTQEAVDTGADTIASCCPYCLTMLTDGTKSLNKDEDVKVKDVAEILNEACE